MKPQDLEYYQDFVEYFWLLKNGELITENDFEIV